MEFRGTVDYYFMSRKKGGVAGWCCSSLCSACSSENDNRDESLQQRLDLAINH